MTTNPNFKPSEGKREEFRKYLEKNGVMDALTKVLVNLYEETDKPENALAFIRDKLAIQAGLETYNEMRDKITESEKRIQELEESIANLSSEPTAEAEEDKGAEEPAPEATEEAVPPTEDAPPEENPAE